MGYVNTAAVLYTFDPEYFLKCYNHMYEIGPMSQTDLGESSPLVHRSSAYVDMDR